LLVVAALAVGVACCAATPLRPVSAPSGIQQSARSVRPPVARAARDRARVVADGCVLSKPARRSPPCVYGDRAAPTSVVLFGDSHAAQYFPALVRVARARHWRLVVLTKSGCTSAAVDTYDGAARRRYWECTAWRRATVRRIEVFERLAVIVMSSSDLTSVLRGHRLLHGLRRSRALARGYSVTVRRLAATEAKVVVLRDLPRAPWEIPPCVAKWMRQLDRCAFSRRAGHPAPDPVETTLRRIRALRLVDPAGEVCVDDVCPAVIHDILVYREQGHLTATFAGKLAPWLACTLRDLP
jgi:hypothetical protein